MSQSGDIGKRNTGPNALRRGRVSIPHASYFITLCLEPRREILLPEIGNGLLAEAHDLERDGGWQLRCATVMPDHVHLFVVLGERLTLSQTMARLKAKTCVAVRERGSDWQANFYDHRLRPDDPVEAVIRYIHANSYAAGLIGVGGEWPWFFCRAEDWVWFRGLTDEGRPWPEWLV